MVNKDLYKILNIAKNASDDEIKKAYRKLAMKYHPDRNAGNKDAEENFKQIKYAYEVLSDREKRATYDQFGHDGLDPNAAGNSKGFGGFADAFGDIFGDIFGNQTNRSGTQVYRGADLRYGLEITLEQAANGFETKIRVPAWIDCSSCKGSGAKSGTSRQNCPVCHGSGNIRMSQGFFSMQQTCQKCQGMGTYLASPCTTCQGVGKTKTTKTLEVKIPAGVDNGMRIRLSGHGEPGVNDGPAGDLYVEVHVKSHSVFEREGDNLHCTMPIPFTVAALGGEMEVPTLSGRAKFTVPAGIQSGKIFRLRGKGIKGVRSNIAGELYVHVQVETPVKLTDRQRELLEEFAKTLEEGGAKHNPQSKSWFEKVKNFF